MTDTTEFTGKSGLTERFFAGTARPGKSFRDECEELLARCQASLGRKPQLLRMHVSDIANQAGIAAALTASLGAAVAVVGQAPICGSRLAVEAYALEPSVPSMLTDGVLSLRLRNYELLFLGSALTNEEGSGPQMTAELQAAAAVLAQRGASLADNLQRTWIYCRDIDNNYAALVAARRRYFTAAGLTADSHYIASTGIEAQSHPHDRLVRMDSFALLGHEAAQIEYMEALTHLSPTHVYGVTFERGTRIIYGDRSHYLLSGTASIDREGRTLHVGDVQAQAERMVDNVSALLENHGAVLKDLRQAVVYLRDAADASLVEAVLSRRLPAGLPRIMVRGSVCRPEWLVEMDGIAVNEQGDSRFKEFC
jgi:enamine deaminase RidA (YjgF/YER057c/UK114 family)